MAAIRELNPVLPSRNVKNSVDYYTNKLGFALAFQSPADNPSYAVIRRDDVTLHLQWQDFTDPNVGTANLRFVVEEIEGLFEEYSTQDVFNEEGKFYQDTKLRKTPWGTREFAFYDPDMNALTFYEDL